ncbi:MAG: DNA repair protein RecN [Prevotella sp.]|nr:DNA repair protein RecN [Prevotella sp.]
MLKQLYIKNFTLIDTLDIQLHPGFSVITGETGAGKSIILGAIGLLLGQRADSKSIKQGADKCVIEAHFDLSHYGMEPFFAENDMEFDPDNTIIRRELTAAGKSRAFVNDTPVPLTVLKELGERLVDVHSQHQNLLLQKQDFQLSVVDILANDTAQLDTYHQLYGELQARQKALQELKETIESNRQREDFLQFQFDELSAARLVDGEQEELEQKSATMTHAEDIKSALFTADNALSGEATGIVTMLRTAASTLRNVERVFPAAAELTARLDSAHIELKDIAQEVAASLSDIDFDPAELDAINARLDKIYDLQRKYHTDSIAGLLDIQADLEQKLAEIENGSDTLQELQQACDKLMAACGQQAAVLTGLRTKAARQIEKDMKQRLEALGMPNVRFAIDISPTELTRSGQDKVQFLFSANSSTSLQPVAQVASGGEIARVMLSLKAMISSAVKLPTIIFDEIDTGVSGKIAEKMAEIMQEMGRLERQVISITHLPQIAALGATHYKVQKTETADGTTSTMTELSQEERVSEIAQMLSGSNVSEAAIANARQLLKI